VFGTPGDQSAFDIINQQLQSWGLGSLGSAAADLIKQGLDANAVTIELGNTPEYKARFAANDTRIKNGLAALKPADYVSAENSYRQVLQQYGLPSGFYDSPKDFNDFIGKDVSPNELNTRAAAAQRVWLSNDDATKETWRDWYGLSDGAAIASILDPDTALPIVQRMAQAAQWGGESRRQGLTADQQRLEQYADQGFTADAVNKGLAQVGAERDTMDKLAARFGQDYNQGTAMDAVIGNNAAASKTRDSLVANESALFSSRAASDSAALTRNARGQY
jgi:hypothetical protein